MVPPTRQCGESDFANSTMRSHWCQLARIGINCTMNPASASFMYAKPRIVLSNPPDCASGVVHLGGRAVERVDLRAFAFQKLGNLRCDKRAVCIQTINGGLARAR